MQTRFNSSWAAVGVHGIICEVLPSQLLTHYTALKEFPHTITSVFVDAASGTHIRDREPEGKGGIRLHFSKVPRHRPRV
jgi:hypothetical protein